MKQQVFSRQESVTSVVFNCLFTSALSPPSKEYSVLRVMAEARVYCAILQLTHAPSSPAFKFDAFASQVPSHWAACGLPNQEYFQPRCDQPAAGGPHHLD